MSKDKPTILEICDDLEAQDFVDRWGHLLTQHVNWTELRRKLGTDHPKLYPVEDGWTELYSGIQFKYREPTTDMIRIADIANAIGKMTRYGGHTHTFYSVAEHSCLLMRWARENLEPAPSNRLMRTILMHDATEAYVPDLARPLKHMLPEFKAFENAVEAVIAERFDLISPHPPIVKELDTRILCDERAQAMNPSDNEWGIDALEPLGVELHFWTPPEAIDNFLGDFMELTR